MTHNRLLPGILVCNFNSSFLTVASLCLTSSSVRPWQEWMPSRTLVRAARCGAEGGGRFFNSMSSSWVCLSLMCLASRTWRRQISTVSQWYSHKRQKKRAFGNLRDLCKNERFEDIEISSILLSRALLHLPNSVSSSASRLIGIISI